MDKQTHQNQPNHAGKSMQDKLHALIDGQLSDAEKAQMLALLADDPQAQETLQAWKNQRESLRSLHREVLDEPIPETLLAAARRGQQVRTELGNWWRWGGMAAAVMLAFGTGWLLRGELETGRYAQHVSSTAHSAQAFAHQASLAYAVYSPEIRPPVEVTATQQEHLVQWLSKRLSKPLKIPVLASQGYELVGGRLLPGEGGARAQFMFQNPAGVRVTLYLGAVQATPNNSQSAVPKASSAETAFRYSNEGPAPSFYWIDNGFGYALSGTVPRDKLMRLAELVYQQL